MKSAESESHRQQVRSLALTYWIPGGGLPAYVCPHAEQGRHLACSYEHAVLAMLLCLFEHMHDGPHDTHGQDISHPVLIRLRADLGAFIQEMLSRQNASSS